jgi:hypothetical protein
MSQMFWGMTVINVIEYEPAEVSIFTSRNPHTKSCDRVLLDIQVKTVLYSYPEKGDLSIEAPRVLLERNGNPDRRGHGELQFLIRTWQNGLWTKGTP